MDRAWWVQYGAEAIAKFQGERIAPQTYPGARREKFSSVRNSGAGAVVLAAHWGARRIVLLGYDCQKTGGRAHWHPDHPRGMGNAGAVDKWPAQFSDARRHIGNTEVINCSRETALTVFPRADLESVLCP